MRYHLTQLIRPLALGVLLLSCSPSASAPSTEWQTYHNDRYGFEFPYPKNWVVAEPPANRDGQVFNDPQNPNVEIRGWASYLLSDNSRRQSGSQPLPPATSLRRNFTTVQGLSGELKVEIGTEMSLMTLTLIQQEVRYNWQGRAPNQEFANYYKFFYYVATQYRVEGVRRQESELRK